MNRFSIGLWRRIFHHLNYDQLCVLSMVNEGLRQLIGDFLTGQIIWHREEDDQFVQMFLFDSDEFITSQRNCLLSHSVYSLLNSSLSSQILMLITFDPFLFAGNCPLTHLQHLEISQNFLIFPEDAPRTIFLNLDHLKVLNIKIDVDYEDEDEEDDRFKLTFYVNCPVLKSLHIKTTSHVRVINPTSIVHLEMTFPDLEDSYASLSSFVNLERLTFSAFDSEAYPGKLIEDLRYLKEINIYSTTIDTLDELVDEKKEFGLHHLKIYYKNVNVEDSSFEYLDIDDIPMNERLTGESLVLLAKLSHCLNRNLFRVTGSAYITHSNCTREGLKFLSNFKRIYHLHVQSRINSWNFYEWQAIMQSIKLSKLEITFPLPQQYLLDEIVNLKLTLEHLSLCQANLNLNFVLELNNLEILDIQDMMIELDLFKQIVKKLKNLSEIKFLSTFKISFSESIDFSYNSNIVHKENKETFLNSTIHFIKFMTQLFDLNIPYVSYPTGN